MKSTLISLFIIDKAVAGRKNAEQLQVIRESLNALEGGRVIDVWALIWNRKLKLTASEVIHNLWDKKCKIYILYIFATQESLGEARLEKEISMIMITIFYIIELFFCF